MKSNNKIQLIWATFSLLSVTSILGIILGRGDVIVASIAGSFAGMTGWLFKIRYDEKKAGLMGVVDDTETKP